MRNCKKEKCYIAKTVMFRSPQTFSAICFSGGVVLNKTVMLNESALFKERYRCTEMLRLFSKTHCCFDSLFKKFIMDSKTANN